MGLNYTKFSKQYGNVCYICISSAPLVQQGNVTHCSVEALWDSDQWSL